MKKVESLKTPKNRFLLTGGTPKCAAGAVKKMKFFQNFKFEIGLNWIWKIIILASWKNVFYFFKNENIFKFSKKYFPRCTFG